MCGRYFRDRVLQSHLQSVFQEMLVSLKLKFAESKLYCCEEFLESGTPIDIALNALNSDTKKKPITISGFKGTRCNTQQFLKPKFSAHCKPVKYSYANSLYGTLICVAHPLVRQSGVRQSDGTQTFLFAQQSSYLYRSDFPVRHSSFTGTQRWVCLFSYIRTSANRRFAYSMEILRFRLIMIAINARRFSGQL